MTHEDIKTIGVVGAGQMGRGISQVCATAGYEVVLLDNAEPALAEALDKIRTGLERSVERGSLSPDEASDIVSRIHPKTALDSLGHAQLVIEAVPEDLSLKTNVFGQLGRIVPPATILASNTSSISITTLGAASTRSDRVVGLHFMNPAPVMELVEVVRGRETSDQTMDRALEFVKRLGSLRLVGLATSVACVLCIAQFALLRPISAATSVAPEVIWLSLLNATACTAVPVLLVMMAVERVGAAVTAQTGMVGPMSTILMGVVILGEPFTAWIAAGTVLVIAGIFVFTRR